jgi:hypothetical protein
MIPRVLPLNHPPTTELRRTEGQSCAARGGRKHMAARACGRPFLNWMRRALVGAPLEHGRLVAATAGPCTLRRLLGLSCCLVSRLALA